MSDSTMSQNADAAFAPTRGDIRDVALTLRAWAQAQGLMSLGGAKAHDRLTDTVGEAFSQSEVGLQVLERQRLTAIGINRRQGKIFVYTNRAVPKRTAEALPQSLEGDQRFGIEYRQAKPVSINSEAVDSVLAPTPHSLHRNHYACGSSISIASVRSAGTLGCLVQGTDGTLFGLTNNHVTGGCNNTRPGMPILAPGVMDVSVEAFSPFTLGYHDAVLPFRQGALGMVAHQENSDAALLKIRDPALVSSMQGTAYDTPSQVDDPIEDMRVEKVGRTTGHQFGVIESEIVGPLAVTYKTTVHHNADESSTFVGTVYFEPAFFVRGDDGPFALPGDSGALVTTVGSDGVRRAVGMVFAGVAPDTSYILPLRPILDQFGVTLVSGHNV